MGLLENLRRIPERLVKHAEILKSEVAAGLIAKAADIREAVGPHKVEAKTLPERAFDGAPDVKRVVWTGHTVRNAEGQSFYGVVGLTKTGYYRTAEVQVYGSDEKWRCQPPQHPDKAQAIGNAQEHAARRQNRAVKSQM